MVGGLLGAFCGATLVFLGVLAFDASYDADPLADGVALPASWIFSFAAIGGGFGFLVGAVAANGLRRR